MMNFTVAILAKNEEAHLPKLLGSLTEFSKLGGDIVIQDGGSTDATAKVAKSFGCRVVDTGDRFVTTITQEEASEFNRAYVAKGEPEIVKTGQKFFDFAAARNHLAEQANHDYVAMPDADEVFKALDVGRVSNAVGKGAYDLFCAKFVWIHDQHGNSSGEFLQRKFYNRKRFKWNPEWPVHEALIGEGRRATLSEDVYRLEHFQNPESSSDSYLAGLAWANFYHGSARNSHYLAREMAWRGRNRSAIAELSRHIAMGGWPVESAQSAIYMGDCFGALRDKAEQIRCYNLAFAIDASRREPLMRLVELYFRDGDFQRVACYATAALEIPLTCDYIYDPANYRARPHHFLYSALFKMGRKSQAKEHWEKALEFEPKNQTFVEDAKWFK